jgi:hypothetical protein
MTIEAQRLMLQNVPPEMSMIDPTLDLFQRMARDPSVPLERIERIVRLIDERQQLAAKREFSSAMAQAQEEMKTIAKDASNPQTQSRYATLAAIDQAIRPIYSKHGLFPSFNTEPSPHGELWVKVTCDLSHRAGHGQRYEVDMPADGKGAKGGDVMTRTHATGAAISYGRRYLLQMMFNLSTADDDGNAASLHAIDEEQLEELRLAIVAAGADIAKFCKLYRIEKVEQLPVTKLDDALKRLARQKAALDRLGKEAAE